MTAPKISQKAIRVDDAVARVVHTFAHSLSAAEADQVMALLISRFVGAQVKALKLDGKTDDEVRAYFAAAINKMLEDAADESRGVN